MKIAALILIAFALYQVEAAFRASPAAQASKDFSFYVFTSEWAGSVCSTNSCNNPHSQGVSKTFWNIHGLWPSDGKMGVNYCSNEKFDLKKISHLKTDLASYWSGLYSSADSFHSHEWGKHGTCSQMSQADYFSTAIKVGKNVDVFAILQRNNIVPGGVYNCQDVANALKKHLKVSTFTLQATGGYLTALKLCVGGATCQLIEYSGNWRKGSSQIKVTDMPGFGDENVPFAKLFDIWRAQLQSKKFNAICFVVRASDHRFTTYESSAIAILQACLQTENPWDNIIFVGTHADKVNEIKEGSVKTRLDNLRRQANKSLKIEKTEKGIWRQVGISLDEDYKELFQKGLRELESHLRDLRGKQIEMKKRIPDNQSFLEIHHEKTGSKCFDGDMRVRVLKEGKVEESKLTEIKLFDMIQVNDGSFESVIVLNRYINEPSLTLDFQVEDQKGKKLNLCLVPYHFMYVMREKQIVHIPARNVTINDKLLYLSKDSSVTSLQITSIQTKMSKDTVNVRTKSRTAIVNDFCCSSVVEGDTGTLGHYFFLACGKIHKKLPSEVNKLFRLLKSAYDGIRNL